MKRLEIMPRRNRSRLFLLVIRFVFHIFGRIFCPLQPSDDEKEQTNSDAGEDSCDDERDYEQMEVVSRPGRPVSTLVVEQGISVSRSYLFSFMFYCRILH